MRIVITGGAGFIGSNLALSLQESNEILAIDKMRSDERFENGNLKALGHFKNLLDFKGELFVGDICESETLQKIESFKPEIIFHQAAISDTTASNQSEVLKVNLNSFQSFIDLALKLNSKLIYASSAAVYGNAPSPQAVGFSEAPRNVYAFSKLMMDKLALKYLDKLHIVGLRYFNVYGKNEFFKGKTASMILQFGLQILAGKNPRLFEGSDKIYRDFVYIKDVVSTNLKALESKSGVYNVGSFKARIFQNIVDILQNELGTNYKSEYFENPYKNAYQFHTEAKKSESFSYESAFSLEDGIKDYLNEIKRIYKEEINV